MIEIQMPREIECTRQLPGAGWEEVPNFQENGYNDYSLNEDGNDLKLNSSVLTSFKALMKLYKLRVDEDQRIVSGGFQQLLNKNPQLASHIVDQQPVCEKQPSSFGSLPVDMKLHIFSFLEAKDLCRAAAVSREWCCLAGDQVLWQNRLKHDVNSWDTISHVTNPAIYQEVNSEWTKKEIYLRCCPQSSSHYKRDFFYIHNIPSLVKSLIWPYTPRVVIFGPALDSSEHHLVGRMMYNNNKDIKLIGLVHGTSPGGLGSGVTLQVNNRQLHLSPLHSGVKSTRENADIDQRMQNNRLLVYRGEGNVEEGLENDDYELVPSVRQLCSTNVDAFVYAMNADDGNSSLSCDRRELLAMLNEKWSAPHIPVLVLACFTKPSKRMSCVDIVDRLKLGKINRPWKVISCHSEVLSGIPEGFSWLMEQVRRQ